MFTAETVKSAIVKFAMKILLTMTVIRDLRLARKTIVLPTIPKTQRTAYETKWTVFRKEDVLLEPESLAATFEFEGTSRELVFVMLAKLADKTSMAK